jgi:hypothetical protein
MMREMTEDTLPLRGDNTKHIHDHDIGALITDSLDVGLYGRLEPERGRRSRSFSISGLGSIGDKRNLSFSTSKDLWNSILKRKIKAGDVVSLHNFQLLEWLPLSPGRYFTPNAAEQRKGARTYLNYQSNEYLPLGKMGMVLGGVGSVRLAPRSLRSGDVCFLCASSNGVSHEGIGLVCPLDETRRLQQVLSRKGSIAVSLDGTMSALPLGVSPLIFDRFVPKYYIFVHKIKVIGDINTKPLVTVAITFNSSDSWRTKADLGDIKFDASKNWSFASFDPRHENDELPEVVEWLKKYTVRHSYKENRENESVPIVGDFDETCQYFDNPVEFPLKNSLQGQYDTRLINLYGATIWNLKVDKKLFWEIITKIFVVLLLLIVRILLQLWSTPRRLMDKCWQTACAR